MDEKTVKLSERTMRKLRGKMPLPGDNTWQVERTMSKEEYAATIEALGLSMAAAGRYLGVTARTGRRYVKGVTTVPVSQVLLLRALVHYGAKALVPDFALDNYGEIKRDRRRKRQAGSRFA